jgi:hypothetical protein
VSRVPARKLAAACTAGLGLGAAVAAYVVVGGLPGLLYAGGIALAAAVGALAILAGYSAGTSEPAAAPGPVARRPTVAPRPPRWRRKSDIIAELEFELASTSAELEEHRQALGNLAAQLSRESEAARGNEERLEQRIGELEAERDNLHKLVAEERERFEQTLDALGGGIGRHGDELAELERELEALIAR